MHVSSHAVCLRSYVASLQNLVIRRAVVGESFQNKTQIFLYIIGKGKILCYHQYWNQPKGKSYYLVDGYAHLSSGLACGLAGLSGLSAVMAIGIVGNAGVRVNAQQPKFFVE
ncbi:hypothetical protein Bca52824_007585 [Brassica carinata]|uniref:Uncharacterized protein n=1 Tax=Brassica carinata TaxID=52824 RepID=A0A8X7W8E5_BRACI|nr:hypothetical protein Bca52824_007585 [Brassica carinata]